MFHKYFVLIITQFILQLLCKNIVFIVGNRCLPQNTKDIQTIFNKAEEINNILDALQNVVMLNSINGVSLK